MSKKVSVGLLGLGTVGTGVASILQNPQDRHPLVSDIEIIKIANSNLFLYLSLNSDHNQYEKINNNKPKTKIQKELMSPRIRL